LGTRSKPSYDPAVPLVPFLVGILLLIVFVLSTPLLLVLRYRAGVMRRRAGVATTIINLISLLISAGLFVWFAALTNFWVNHAFSYSLVGLSAGVVLGLAGLFLTRWEKIWPQLYYTPSRGLVLLISLTVGARLLYGLWRIWHAWRHSGPDASWLGSAGVAGSMAVGAIVLGYYLTYMIGVCWQLRSTRYT
jgi:hypothetical protein